MIKPETTTTDKPSWEDHIEGLKKKPTIDRTDKENLVIHLADILTQYDIDHTSEITKEIHDHHFGIGDKEQTVIHRDILRLSSAQRNIDIKDPCRPGKFHLRIKGDVIDRLCDFLGIRADKNFHGQIQHARIYAEDVMNSEWYRYILRHEFEVGEIFGLTVGDDFADNPLKFFKSFCFKAMGIVCTLHQQKSYHPDDHEDLWKEHKKHDIYRKHYKEVFPKPRYAPTKMKACSDDWIDRKIKDGVELTLAEKRLRALRKHVEIHAKQPSFNGYLSDTENSILYKLKMKNKIKNSKQNGGKA